LPPPAGIPASPTGDALAGLIAPAPAPLPVVPTRLRIRRVRLDVLEGTTATVAGALRPLAAGHTLEFGRAGLAGRTVELQRLGRRGWHTIVRVPSRARGAFVFHYIPHRLLSERLRVLFAGDGAYRAARRDVGRLSSYRLAGASWYGGGGGLACGGRLTSSTMGVANKTLPCGTLVTLRYGGHEVRVPVVDRGPYVAGREFDLTEATKRALGFEGTGEVWSTR
jgi:peptidoglycan lytic transglycosylase